MNVSQILVYMVTVQMVWASSSVAVITATQGCNVKQVNTTVI